MPAPINNKFAEKWTKATVNDVLDEMIEVIKERDKAGRPIYSITKLLGLTGLYNRFPHYMREKFGKEKELMNKLDYIYTIVEGNLYERGIEDPDVNAGLVQFGLKAFHKRFDEQHINLKSDNKNTQEGEITINFEPSNGIKKDE